jgi:hypothetical protein
MSQANKDELPFKVTRRIVRKAKRAVANIDPFADRANKSWNTSQYGLIQDRAFESEFGFDRYWGEKMRQQRNGQRTNNYPSPQQRTRSLEEIINWWQSNNPYMNGTGLVFQPLPTKLEGGKNGNEILDKTVYRNITRPEDDPIIGQPVQPDNKTVPGGG